MKIKYSPHAQKRLRQRKITKKDVRIVLTNPDTLSSVTRNRQIARKKIKDQILEVVFVVENKVIIIITLYYL